jgi:hypothetical protein
MISRKDPFFGAAFAVGSDEDAVVAVTPGRVCLDVTAAFDVPVAEGLGALRMICDGGEGARV